MNNKFTSVRRLIKISFYSQGINYNISFNFDSFCKVFFFVAEIDSLANEQNDVSIFIPYEPTFAALLHSIKYF